MCGGGKGGTSTQQQTSTTQIPPEVLARYNDIYNRGTQAANQPFQEYPGQFVAPLTPTQQGGIGTIGMAEQALGPYATWARDTLGQGITGGNQLLGQAGGLIPGASTPGALNINKYLQPGFENVIDPVRRLVEQQQGQQQNDLRSQEIMAGAFGGDRSSIAKDVLSGQQNLAMGNVLSPLYQQNYAQALQAAQQQQGVNLAAKQWGEQATAGLAGQTFGQGAQGAQGYNSLLGGFENAALGQGQAQVGAGTLEQQTGQAGLSALYNQWLQQQAYPFQTTQFLANIASGIPFGQTTSMNGTAFQPQPFFSDDRLKENVKTIGHTDKGLRIVRYNHKDDPHKVLRIGFLASDVEKKMPEAVSHHAGLRAVDYDRAARAAGGLVGPSDMREGYAGGGDPMAAILQAHQAMYPGVLGRPGIGDTGPRGMQLHPTRAPRAVQPAGTSMAMPKQAEPELKSAIKDVNDISGAVKSGKGLYSAGKEAIVGAPEIKDPYGNVTSPATGGILGRGGKWEGPWGSGATGGGIPAPSTGGVMGSITTNSLAAPTGDTSANLAAPVPMDTSSLAGLTPDLNSGWFANAGGRMKRAAGGLSGAMPYTIGAPGYIPEEDYEPEDPLKKIARNTQAQQTSGIGGGGRSAGSGLGDLASLAGLGKMGFEGASALGGLFGSTAPLAGASEGVGALADIVPMLGFALKRGGRTGYDAGGVIPDEHAETVRRARHAIGHIESGNRYDALGPYTGSDRPHGRYQVMGANIPSWTRTVTGRAMTPDEFRASPEVQDAVFDHYFGKALREHGTPEDAASVWFSGRPLHQTHGEKDVLGTSVPSYVSKFASLMGGKGGDDGGVAPRVLTAATASPPGKGLVPPVMLAELDPDEFEDRDIVHQYGLQRGGRAGFDDGGVPSIDDDRRRAAELDRLQAAGALPVQQRYSGAVVDPGITPPDTPPLLPTRLEREFPPYIGPRNALGEKPALQGGSDSIPSPVSRETAPAQPTFATTDIPLPGPGDADVRPTPAPAPAPRRAPSAAPVVAPQPSGGLAPPLPGNTTVADLNSQNRPIALPATLPSPASQTSQAAPKDFMGRAGDWFDRNEKYLVPALSFLGNMLASPSRTLAGAVGGGLAGVAQALPLQQRIGQEQQRIGITQRSQDIQVLAMLRQQQSARVQNGLPPDPALDQQISAIMTRLASSEPAPGSPNQPAGGAPTGVAPAATPPAGAGVAAPVPAPAPVSAAPLPSPAPTVAPAGNPPASTSPWGPMPSLDLGPVKSQVDPDWNPDILQERAKATAAYGDAAGAARLRDRAAQAQARMESVGTLPAIGGGTVSIPGFTERQVAQQNVIDNQKTLQNETAAAVTRQTTHMQLGAIKNLLQSYESGSFADVQAEAQAVSKALGIPLPDLSTMDAQKFQEFVKNAYGVMLSASAMNKDETDRLRDMVGKTFASPTMQPGANRKILAETEGVLNLADKKFADFTRDVAAAKHLPQSQWFDQWRRQPENRLETMVEKARRETPVMGDVPTRHSDLEEGTQYILRPTDAIKLFAGRPKKNGEPLTAEEIKKQFGDRKHIRVVIQNGAPVPVQ